MITDATSPALPASTEATHPMDSPAQGTRRPTTQSPWTAPALQRAVGHHACLSAGLAAPMAAQPSALAPLHPPPLGLHDPLTANGEEALAALLNAEVIGPDQVRYHQLSRDLVRDVLTRPRPPRLAVQLSERMGVRSQGPRW